MTAALLDIRPADTGSCANGGFARFTTHVWPVLGLTGSLCRFSVAAFDDELFTFHGVECGPALAGAVPKRRAEYLAGRLCAAQALGRLGASGPVVTGRDRSPVWPLGVTGSITHCGEAAMAVALSKGRVRGVGIDLERRAACLEASLDARYFANEAELSVLERAGIARKDRAVLAFSVKESFFKAAYPEVGRYFGFSAVSITGADPARRILSLTVAEDLGGRLTPGFRAQGEYSELDEAFVATAVVV